MPFLDQLRSWARQRGLYEMYLLMRNAGIVLSDIKALGYDLARHEATRRGTLTLEGQPTSVGLVSKPTTQADVDSAWFAYWCAELQVPPIYHRKMWELAFALQVLYDHGCLATGRQAIGFGCGEEPLASYFAHRGVAVTVTDQAPDARVASGWQASGQHATSLDHVYKPHLVTRASFDAQVTHRYIDMRRLPRLDPIHDFCWSICAMEHLGSLEQGLDFVVRSAAALRPGGIGVHTTEFNMRSDGPTVERGPTVLYQQKHIQQLQRRLATVGCTLLGPSFDAGNLPLDSYIDIPLHPPERSLPGNPRSHEYYDVAHLKMAVAGFPVTCYGLVVRKD